MEHLPGDENVLADRLSRWHKHEETVRRLDPRKERNVVIGQILDPVWKQSFRT